MVMFMVFIYSNDIFNSVNVQINYLLSVPSEPLATEYEKISKKCFFTTTCINMSLVDSYQTKKMLTMCKYDAFLFLKCIRIFISKTFVT